MSDPNFALVVKVMRLQPPTLHFKDTLLSPSDLEVDTWKSQPFASHVVATHPGPIGSTLITPQAFGGVFLGEMFTSIVTVSNVSSQPANNVSIKVSLATEKNTAILHTTPSQLPTLQPGQRQEIIIRHEIKELGPHTLVIAPSYTPASSAGAPEETHKHQPLSFRFTSSNPLTVRTKQRVVGNAVLLEVTLENKTKTPMLLDSVRLLGQQYTSQEITTSTTESSTNDASKTRGPLSSYISSLPLLTADGGAMSYVYRLTRQENHNQATRESPTVGAGSLGKIEIKWRGRLGEQSRLQTQTVSIEMAKELRLTLSQLPQRVALLKPFKATVLVQSSVSDRVVGPVKVSLAPVLASSKGQQGCIAMQGCQSIVVDEVSPDSTVRVDLDLVALASGAQLLQGIILTDERDGRVYDALQPVDVYVDLE